MKKRSIYRDVFVGWRADDEWATVYCHGFNYLEKEAEKYPDSDFKITHWMPLPKPPVETDQPEKRIVRSERMSETLERCPFCGSEVRLTNIDPNDDYYMIECQNENCNSATCFGEVNEEEIKKRWNGRVVDER